MISPKDKKKWQSYIIRLKEIPVMDVVKREHFKRNYEHFLL